MPLPKFKFKWFENLSGFALAYGFVNMIVNTFEVMTYWLDIPGYRNTIVYVFIYLGFILPPFGMGILLLIGVKKKELKKVWIWWIIEIALLALYLTLFMLGLYRVSIKGFLNLAIYTLVRILGLKIIFDFMITLNIESSITKIEPSKTVPGNPFETVSLEDERSPTEKF